MSVWYRNYCNIWFANWYMAKLTWHNLCNSSSCSWLALCHRIFMLILGIPTTDWSNSLLESIGSSLQDFEACEMFLTGKGSSLGDESSQSLLSLGSGGVVERFISKKISPTQESMCQWTPGVRILINSPSVHYSYVNGSIARSLDRWVKNCVAIWTVPLA